MPLTENQINDAVLKSALFDYVMDALAGHPVCDFADSFIEVAAAQAMRKALEDIAAGQIYPEDRAKGVLLLLGNFDPDQPQEPLS
jgi:hypothetical protein